MHGVDILKDLCGVRHYDHRLSTRTGRWRSMTSCTSVNPVARPMSVRRSFWGCSIGMIRRMTNCSRRGYPERSVRGTTLRPSIKHAYWALAQYDFVYKRQPGRKADERAPLFLGVFDWNDSEDDELLAAWARGEG